jgi:hypothetical protein
VRPHELVAKLRKLGLREVPNHSSKNYVWMELADARSRVIAVANIPTSKPQVSVGLQTRLFHRMGIQDEDHLDQLVKTADPAAALRAILPPDAARYRAGGQ